MSGKRLIKYKVLVHDGRTIYEFAILQPQGLSMRKLPWNRYIDIEIEEGERGQVRTSLYKHFIESVGTSWLGLTLL